MISPCYNRYPAKKKQFERMRGCICSFMIENGSFIEWEAETGIVNQLNTFQISVKYFVYTQFMAASALLRNTMSTEE